MQASDWMDNTSWIPDVTSNTPAYPLNATREQKISIIKRAVMSELGSWQVKRKLKEELSAQASALGGTRPSGDVLGDIEGILSSTRLGVQLKNMIYNVHRKALLSSSAPPDNLTVEETYCADRLDYVEDAKLQWEKRIRRELDVMAAELGVPLQRRKTQEPPKPQENQAFRFVYDDNDFLDIICNISRPNPNPSQAKIPRWGLIQVELGTRDVSQLKDYFKEFDPRVRCLGVDDDAKPQFADDQAKRLQASCDYGFIPAIRQVAKHGIPQRSRPAVWHKLLGIDLTDVDRAYFDHLYDGLKEWELVTDDLMRYDVAGVSDDNKYFVFEDILSDSIGVMSRDPWVCLNATVASQANDKMYDSNVRVSMVFPPCGVVPFQGMVLYGAPLCYLWSDIHELYYGMRAFFSQYCCRLNTISSNEETNPELVFHLCELGLPPLKVAFNWIFFAFAGYLEVDQVLCLWDRILAWDSLLILPVVAAAILSFRERALLECASAEEVKQVLEDATKQSQEVM